MLESLFFTGIVNKNTNNLPNGQVRKKSVISSLRLKLSASLSSLTEKVNPFYVTGFCDAECSFILDVFKQKNWRVAARFRIHLHSIDLPLLYKIQSFFGGIGSVNVNGQTASFRVSKIDDIINVIIPHFNQYPLQSAKLIDFQL
jgi:hypothetical protein